MKILYVANHQAGQNDDEGAIAYALRQLGHEVAAVSEGDTQAARSTPADLCLFHKWANFETVRRIGMVKVFWYFDRVVGWADRRRRWMETMTPLVDVGFATDGDWVDQSNRAEREADREEKMVFLPQGADERVVGRGTPDPAQAVDVLCVAGTKFHGLQRQSFVTELATFCAERGYTFRHVEEGIYREELRDLVASSKVVVAPDSPVSDRYASNRVWNMLGFGAFLLHPRCWFLIDEFGNDVEWYESRPQLLKIVDWAMRLTYKARCRGSEAGLSKVRTMNLYRHRCQKLISIVEERTK